MSMLERLKQARSTDELASEIEPLAQALAALADDTRAAMSEQLSQQEQQTSRWNEREKALQASWGQVAKDLREVVQEFNQQAQRARKAANAIGWRMILTAALIGVLSAPVAIGFWIYLPHLLETEQNKNYRELGKDVNQRWNKLTDKEKDAFRRLMGWPDQTGR